jgi:tetratricopeptide (TPR) repeat protein
MAAATSIDAGTAELLAGRPAAAEEILRPDFEELDRLGERTLLSTMAGLLGLALSDQDRYGEAARMSEVAEKAAAEDDRESQALWRRVRARVEARTGDARTAESLARQAVGHVRGTEAPVMLADALSDLSEVMILAGRAEEAVPILDEALELYESKGNRPGAARSRRALEALASGPKPA